MVIVTHYTITKNWNTEFTLERYKAKFKTFQVTRDLSDGSIDIWFAWQFKNNVNKPMMRIAGLTNNDLIRLRKQIDNVLKLKCAS